MPETETKPGDGAAFTGSAEEQQSMTQELWSELERAQQLARQVSHWSGGMLNLAWLELRVAASAVPRMLGLAVALLPLAGLTWISLSILLAWLAYVATDVATVGFVTLFVLQLAATLFCVSRLKRLKRQASMPETREQWHRFFEEMKHNQQADTREATTGNRS